MKRLEWLVGASLGVISGVWIQAVTKELPIYKMKVERKKEEFYEVGKIHHHILEASKEKLRNEAQQNILGEENEIGTTNTRN
ncbi:hypothetical protein LCL89_12265 [Halobacillus yeomjeoni]|uniref:hypothetical protein n=1 Tax=Halobacillus yeomjeoni TaxID=311194 RepID=UPI001CD7F142|nr:hypothetical protein [Halobacillus yeomjeoni]MCA0984823.1 hypothetical protein [Halobacillus yeomjeoni]